MVNRYVKRSRISEATFRLFLRHVAADLTAVQIATLTGLNRNTVNRLLRSLRQRMALACEAQSPFRGEVEIDESYFGPKRVRGKRGRGAGTKTIVFGVNDETLSADDLVVSNASCTTNCLSPVAKVLNDTVGIERGYMTTVHAYTGDQPTLDRMHKDLYRARAAASSMIPTSTGAAKAVGLVLPELEGKLNGSAVRVPTPNVSMIDLVFDASRETTVEEVNSAIEAAANGPMKGVLGYSTKPLVSADFNHDAHSSTFAAGGTNVTDGTLVRVLSWYDNEWGFATRMSDTALAMAKYL